MRLLATDASRKCDQSVDLLSRGPQSILVKILSNSNAEIRSEALQALAILGPDAKETLPDLVALFADADVQSQTRIVKLVAVFGEKNQEVKSLLLKSLKDPSAELRIEAAESIGALYQNSIDADIIDALAPWLSAHHRIGCRIQHAGRHKVASGVNCSRQSKIEICANHRRARGHTD